MTELFQAILKGDARAASAAVQSALDSGAAPVDLLQTQMVPAMDEVGRAFECGDYFVPELLLAGRAMKAALEPLRPLLAAGAAAPAGRIVIGTVQGDLHDIGKNIVVSMLEGAGFAVTDLGVDVSSQKFVNAVRRNRPDILCLSALLTVTMPAMKATIGALATAGLRDQVRVMIGGAPVSQSFADEIGADGYSDNAAAAVALARRLMSNS